VPRVVTFRSTTSVLALLAALTVPALAADYGDWEDYDDSAPDFRSGYPTEPGDWAGLGDTDDPIALEFGLRYWYSKGDQSFTSSGGTVSSGDTAHIGELHLRIEDHSTNTFATAIAGYSIAINGDVTTPTGTYPISDGEVLYGGADLGWNVWGDNNGSGIGAMVGYLYWKDAPDTGRFSYSTANSASDINYDTGTGQTFLPGDSTPNSIDAHALRLGVSGKAKLGDFFDVTATVAGVPYAKVGGTAGIDDPTFSIAEYSGAAQPPYDLTESGNIASIRSSPTSIDGWGYGAMVEGFIGAHPTENLSVRLGGRLWYLQGTADTTYNRIFVGDPVDTDADLVYDQDPSFVEQGYISTNNPFRMMRYGLLAEATYSF
jgi:hypothetical protein